MKLFIKNINYKNEAVINSELSKAGYSGSYVADGLSYGHVDLGTGEERKKIGISNREVKEMIGGLVVNGGFDVRVEF